MPKQSTLVKEFDEAYQEWLKRRGYTKSDPKNLHWLFKKNENKKHGKH